jgi:hypothetical protein
MNSNSQFYFICTCPPGYTGTRCDYQIDVCQSNPCINGACLQPSPNLWQCQCRAGYTGLICDVDVNECNSNPCVSGRCTTPFPNMYL